MAMCLLNFIEFNACVIITSLFFDPDKLNFISISIDTLIFSKWQKLYNTISYIREK